MFRQPPRKRYTVYSTLDPDWPELADAEEYRRTLDASGIDTSDLTPIVIATPTVAQRCDLRGRIAEAVHSNRVSADTPATAAEYMRAHWSICALKCRLAVREVGGEVFGADDDGYASPDVVEFLGSPEAVEEIAGYIDKVAHLDPPSGPSGDGAQ